VTPATKETYEAIAPKAGDLEKDSQLIVSSTLLKLNNYFSNLTLDDVTLTVVDDPHATKSLILENLKKAVRETSDKHMTALRLCINDQLPTDEWRVNKESTSEQSCSACPR
jgi:hypothetical protein